MPTGLCKGGPLDGQTVEFSGSYLQVPVMPRIPISSLFDENGQPLAPPRENIPSGVVVTYEVAEIWRDPKASHHLRDLFVLRPRGTFRRDGKPVDPRTN